MPGFKLAFTLAVAAIAIGKYFLDKKDDDPTPPAPPRDPYHPSSSYNSGTTRTQTQQSHGVPPLPSYTYRSPEINAHSQATLRTPAPPDYSRGAYRSTVIPPYTRTPTSQVPSHQHPSLLNTVHIHESTEYEYIQTSSRVPERVHDTGSEPHPPTVIQVASSDLRSEEPAGVEDLDYAKKLRVRARHKGQEMSDARSRAKSAQKKGRGGAAHAHRRDAIAHESAMKALDKQAAKIFFRENNKNRKEGGKIDLHNLFVAEAVQFAKDQVQTASKRGDDVVRFIVGKGLHSDAGVPKIRLALEGYFTKRGLTHSLDLNNTGVLIVRLDDNKGLFDTISESCLSLVGA